MTWRIPTCALTAIIVALTSGPAFAEKGPELPVIDGQRTLATVNGESITLEAYLLELSTIHVSAEAGDAKRPRQRPSELLDRLINVRLILQEAGNIGLDEMPEVQDALRSFRGDALRSMLLKHEFQHLAPDEAELDALYRRAVEKHQVSTALLADEEQALAFAEAVRAGAEFDELALRMAQEGAIEDYEKGRQLKVEQAMPNVKPVLAGMEIGDVSPPVENNGMFLVMMLEDVIVPDEPDVREMIVENMVQSQRAVALDELRESLKQKYVKIDQELLDALDFETEETDFASLLEDDRAVAEIEGDAPVTVGDLAQKMKQNFFHGIDKAMGSGRINRKKNEYLYEILSKRLITKEAHRLKLDQSPEYEAMVANRKNNLVFGMFMQKVIDPDIKLDDKALTSFFEEHIENYSSPEMIRLESLAFVSRSDAEAALGKLEGGADFKWLRQNAAGQVPATESPLEFPAVPLIRGSLPTGVGDALAAAQAGALRLYTSPEGPTYLLHVAELVPGRPSTLESVKEQVFKHALAEHRQLALEQWAAELRAASEVEVFATGDDLLRVLGMKTADAT